MADWLDDHDGKHRYGVRFPSDGKIYGSRECFECTWPDLLAEIERLRAALFQIAHQKYGSQMSCVDNYNALQTAARAALAGKKTND
jgi:hypothetical protein